MSSSLSQHPGENTHSSESCTVVQAAACSPEEAEQIQPPLALHYPLGCTWEW